MTKTLRRLTSIGLAAAAATGLTLGFVPSAQAATWNYSAPTKATSVKTVKSAALPKGGTLQVRTGKYNGNRYYWGRVYSPGSTYNSDHDVRFQAVGDWDMTKACLAQGLTKNDIDRTTYTGAAKTTGCIWMAYVVKRSTGKLITSITYDAR
ncbi:MAG TPA: hypothetical protein VGL05_02490 [Kribbella sp.]